MGVTRYFSEGSTYIAIVKEVTSSNAKCVTSFQSEITIEWANALPNPAPRVGEIWYVHKEDGGYWTFGDKLTSGSYNAMHYAMILDARTCVGKERAIVDDIHKSGVDEVYLVVASDGIVMWDATRAKNFGLKSFGDYVTQLVNRFSHYGIAVTFVIDCELWPANSKDMAVRKYQQVYYDENDELKFANRFSPKAATRPVKYLVDDLYKKYHDKVRGVCFRNFGLVNERADFSAANRVEYFSRYKVEPDVSFVEDSTNSETWYASRLEWVQFQTQMYDAFLKTIQEDIGNWPVSTIVTDEQIYNGSADEKLGRLHTGIDDDFAKLSWSRVGLPLSFNMQTDKTAALRSFEYLIAYEKRLAQGSSPLYVVDIEKSKDYDAILEILSRYDADTVLFDDYDKWKLLSDKEVISLNDAMNSYRVVERSEQDYAGILLSSNSRDISCFSNAENRKWHTSIEALASIMLDRLPHRLKVFFDSDIEDKSSVDEVAMIVLFMAENMTDKAIDNVCDFIQAQDKNIVVAGIAGSKEANINVNRGQNKILEQFEQKSAGQREYSRYIHIGKNKLDVAGSVFLFNDTFNQGVAPAFPSDIADGYERVIVNGESEYDEVEAPIYFKNRSSLVGIDMLDDQILLSVVGELVLYALGRDA